MAHFDLMLAVADRERLLTWRVGNDLGAWPEEGMMAVERIADHRRIYLTYEGEISGGRGVVKRGAEGVARIVDVAGGVLVVEVAGRLLRLPL